MENNVNYKGVESIRKYIESSGRNYFAIFQVGRKAQPVWKQVSANTAKKASELFGTWADTILLGDPTHSIVYELRMYENTADEAEDLENEAKPVNMRAGRSGLVMTFCLNATANQSSVGQPAGSPSGYISPDLLEAKLALQEAAFENRILKMEQKTLEQRLNDIEAQLEEDTDTDGMSGVNDMMEHPLVKMFMPLIANSMAGPASAARPVISGLPHNDILTEALAILSDGNPEYANDLMKIATIKRDNPVMYNAIIQQLRSM